MNRGLLLLVLAALVAVAGWWFFLRPPASKATEWQGYADADFVKVGPTEQGLVTAIHVRRGDKVAKGEPLFDQDDTSDKASLDQASRQLAQARQQLANLESGGKPTEIAQAVASLADVEAARDKMKTDLGRDQTLLKSGAASAQLVDQEQADARSAEAKVAVQQAVLAQLRAPMGRPDEIKAQEAAVKALQAALDVARWRLDQRHVASSVSGVVADTLAEPGETLAAGAPVVSLFRPRIFSCASSCLGLISPKRMRATTSRCSAIPAPPISSAKSPISRRRPNIRRRSSTANRRAPNSCSWSRRGQGPIRRPCSIPASR